MLKGQCHEIFDFWFFSWISFPQAPEYSIRAISNFFENSRRYLQFNLHHRCRWHRWQMKKFFNLKNFNYFVWTPLGRRVNTYLNICLQVHFKVSVAWCCSHFLPLVLLMPVAICHWRCWHQRQICHQYRWHRWQICHRCGVSNTSETGGKICPRCRWQRWCTWTSEYPREFLKKFEMTLMLFSEAWGRVIHEKNLKQKISWHCPYQCDNI